LTCFPAGRKTANKGESEFDRLDIAEVLLDRVLYNVQAGMKEALKTKRIQ